MSWALILACERPAGQSDQRAVLRADRTASGWRWSSSSASIGPRLRSAPDPPDRQARPPEGVWGRSLPAVPLLQPNSMRSYESAPASANGSDCAGRAAEIRVADRDSLSRLAIGCGHVNCAASRRRCFTESSNAVRIALVGLANAPPARAAWPEQIGRHLLGWIHHQSTPPLGLRSIASLESSWGNMNSHSAIRRHSRPIMACHHKGLRIQCPCAAPYIQKTTPECWHGCGSQSFERDAGLPVACDRFSRASQGE